MKIQMKLEETKINRKETGVILYEEHNNAKAGGAFSQDCNEFRANQLPGEDYKYDEMPQAVHDPCLLEKSMKQTMLQGDKEVSRNEKIERILANPANPDVSASSDILNIDSDARGSLLFKDLDAHPENDDDLELQLAKDATHIDNVGPLKFTSNFKKTEDNESGRMEDICNTWHVGETSWTCSPVGTFLALYSKCWWRFPLQHHHQQQAAPEPERISPALDPYAAASFNLAEAFRAAELQFASGARLPALRLLEKFLAPDASPTPITCPPAVMSGVVAALRDQTSARPAAKVLLALLLSEHNRRAAVDAGASSAAVEAVAASGPAGVTAERALAALELLCTVPDGAEEVRGHSAAAAALAGAVEGMSGRGRECAIGVMAAIYGGADARDVPPEVGRAVVAAMQGECSARGRRKGAQLLRALQENGRLNIPTDTAIGQP
ncbi:hypothetical protein ZIOFF_029216 [Zingiber officinale]|uniref:U-box domain-containing protein n=1 Tax=Zingiber officinale TaxID=94328 RepID=A0A8J5GWB8_ZINOF|nr:hypothetical protein ZIOFF_029216 [Zingiber officinale]